MPRFRALRLKYVSLRSSFNRAGFEKSIAKGSFSFVGLLLDSFSRALPSTCGGPLTACRCHCVMNFPRSLIESLRAAKKIVALTGAGISSESGLATFRDAQTGLWSKFRPEELATVEAFQLE